MVNLEWYRTFIAIYQQGNLTKAAEELFISQPNVSVQLAALEAHVGYKLFVRQPRKLIPTEEGKMLYTQVVNSIENLERVEATFRRTASTMSNTIRIGGPREFGTVQLINALTQCDAHLVFTFDMVDELLKLLTKGELDFFIATQQIHQVHIKYIPLVEEQFYLVASRDYDTSILDNLIREAQYELLSEELLGYPWVSYDHKLSVIRRFWKVNFNKRPLITPRLVVPDMLGIRQAVAMGTGLTILSNLFIGEDCTDIRILWEGSHPATNQLYLAYHENKEESEQLKLLKDALNLV